MASLFATKLELTDYHDFKYPGTRQQFEADLLNSNTLYVGNLSFYTTEEQIYELFSKCGEIKRIIMGLDRNKKTPCGFCFVEYYSHADAVDCLKYINATKLDERIIRTDWDPGYREGRQYGRGLSGGQVRDEFRVDYDAGRGGWGPRVDDDARRTVEAKREAEQAKDYVAINEIPTGHATELKEETVKPEDAPAALLKRERVDDDEEEEDSKKRSRGESSRFDRKRRGSVDDEDE